MKISTKDMVLASVMAAVMCVFAIISFNIGQVPITLSMFAVFLCGLLQKPKYAVLSCVVYVLLGAIGIPVFAGMKGGLSVLMSPTGGFIISYPVVVLIISLFVQKFSGKTFAVIISLVIAIFVCYTFGTVWFMIITGSGLLHALSICVLPFIPFEIIKAAAALLISKPIKKAILKSV
jgi:biotin transport system substrate-specific component